MPDLYIYFFGPPKATGTREPQCADKVHLRDEHGNIKSPHGKVWGLEIHIYKVMLLFFLLYDMKCFIYTKISPKMKFLDASPKETKRVKVNENLRHPNGRMALVKLVVNPRA